MDVLVALITPVPSHNVDEIRRVTTKPPSLPGSFRTLLEATAIDDTSLRKTKTLTYRSKDRFIPQVRPSWPLVRKKKTRTVRVRTEKVSNPSPRPLVDQKRLPPSGVGLSTFSESQMTKSAPSRTRRRQVRIHLHPLMK